MTDALAALVAGGLAEPVAPAVAALAERLGTAAKAQAVLFYGSNRRTGALDGVLDFYILTAGPRERGMWPRVGYREEMIGGRTLRVKVATMRLATFRAAASDETLDTTVWARFVQPASLAWSAPGAEDAVRQAVAAAAITAARYAAALGPAAGSADDYWRALFRATYRAELRVEAAGREAQILAADPRRWAQLLPAAWAAAGIEADADGDTLRPRPLRVDRARLLARWRRRRRAGKPINAARLVRAAFTFDGAARYAAWKIERHTGVAVALTPWRERHPVLAAPGVLWRVWRARAG